MLISCPECGREVSDKAPTCPHCGVRIAGNPEIKTEPEFIRKPTSKITRAHVNEKGGNKYLTLLICFLFVVVIIIGGSIFIYHGMQEKEEEMAYDEAMISNNPEDLQRYLAKYGNAPQEHRDSVKAHLQMMRDNVRAMEQKAEKDAIDSTEFSNAKRLDTKEAYQKYLKNHPNGNYVSEATELLNILNAKTATPEEIAAARDICKRFFQAINARNESKLLTTIPDVLTSFLNKIGANSDDVIAFMNKQYKADVTNLNWHILDDFNVEKSLDENGNTILKAKFSVEQNIERTDPDKENYNRYVVSVDINPEGKIINFNMKKQISK